CVALCLQREGFDVLIIERDAPGEACSFGNAGGMGGGGSVAPLALPGIVRAAPRLLFDADEPLFIRWRDSPAMIPWFIRFARESALARVERNAAARASILGAVQDAYAPLIEAAGAQDLVVHGGALTVFESRDALKNAGYALELGRRYGVAMEEVDGDKAREINPALGSRVACGIVYPDSAGTINPLRLTQTLIEHFKQEGGTVRKETVLGFEFANGSPTHVITNAGTESFELAVIAAGVWSKDLAAKLGTRVLMEAQRGYHAMLPEPGISVPVRTSLADRNVIITPMEHGLRITGIAEFSHPEAPPNYVHAERIIRQARQFLPDLNADGASMWVGPRPQTPDTLPVIGPSPHHRNVLFAFGHGQNGLQLAAITGKLVSELASGHATSIDIGPFRPDRF
ncbi:MAG: FAD-binding oxidoreductase, partial [Rhodospirillales bacterium]|nr:FAD-binding oxidoreductase [Rhodospirillales bacterium]